MAAHATTDDMYWACVYSTPLCVALVYMDLSGIFGVPGWYSPAMVAAYVWIPLAFTFAVRSRSKRRSLVLLCLTPLACGWQLFYAYFVIVGRIVGFAP
jgi:hypothetical protein